MSDHTYFRSDELLSRVDTRLLIVDVQEKLMPLIADRERVTGNLRRLIEAARLFDVPIDATEQYPRGLGPTVPEIAELLEGVDVPEKVRFSSVECLGWPAAGETEDVRDKVVVAGIEAHVCVCQTVFDLLSMGYRAYVPVDAVSSRHERDRDVAFQRFRDAGAVLTTTESVLFELCEVAGTTEFKEISRLVKEGDAAASR